MSPLAKPWATELTTASAALEMPLIVFEVESAVATEVIVPVGVRAMMVPFRVLNARKQSPKKGEKKPLCVCLAAVVWFA